MGLLHDIQAAVLDDGTDLGPILLKVRLLAARLGSQALGEWVNHESEGYPENAAVPEYRKIQVSYTATFSGPFGRVINEAPIPSLIIEDLAGEGWTAYEFRGGVAAVDDLLASTKNGGGLSIEASNLIFRLQGKIYPGNNCMSVSGRASRAALAELKHAVRSRVLELTIQLEKELPEAALVTLTKTDLGSETTAAKATQISHQIIYGNLISASGNATVTVIAAHDLKALVQFLAEKGLPEHDAKELGDIIASERPETSREPLGRRAKQWLLDRAADGTWKIAVSVATELAKEAAMKYYGMK
jgi:AbiTii